MTIEATNPESTNDDTAAVQTDAPADTAADQMDDASDEATALGGGEDKAPDGEEGKSDADEGAAGAPEKYDLKAPDGFDAIDTEVLGEAEPVLRDLNLSNEQAQQLMPLAGQLVKRTLDRAEAAITQRAVDQRKEWADAFAADPEIGGANKDATLSLAAKAFDHYGIKPDEGLRQLLNESGLGNHPDLIRFVSRVGRDLAEGTFDRGQAASAPKAPEQKLYGPEFQGRS